MERRRASSVCMYVGSDKNVTGDIKNYSVYCKTLYFRPGLTHETGT